MRSSSRWSANKDKNKTRITSKTKAHFFRSGEVVQWTTELDDEVASQAFKGLKMAAIRKIEAKL